MKLNEIKFEDLSDITYRMFLYECAHSDEANHRPKVLVIEFVGNHGIGSEGNNDSLFMATVIKAALNIWYVDGLVLDFGKLAYEWGDTIGDVLLAGKSFSGRKFPTAVIVSGICKPALESAQPFYAIEGDQQKWLFDDFESANSYIEEQIELSRQQSGSKKKSFWRR